MPIERHQIATTDPQTIERFAKGGNAIITVVSMRSGSRMTYRVAKLDRIFAIKVLSGPDNSDPKLYQYIGKAYLDRQDRFVHGGPKARAGVDAPSVQLFTWFWRNLHAALRGTSNTLDQCEVWHEGRCGKCGHRLTVPESLATGLGPECSKVLGVVRPRVASRRNAKRGKVAQPRVTTADDRHLGLDDSEHEMQRIEAEGD